MKEYQVIIPNERLKTYRFMTFFILLLHCFVFAYIASNMEAGKMKSVSLLGATISVSSLLFFAIQTYSKKIPAFKPEVSFIIISLCWIIIGKYLVALFVLLFAVLGFYTNRKFIVRFTKDKIVYPTFPAKEFVWADVNNAMLKDNVLTIDLRNNKVIQAVIEKESAGSIDEREFNEFCKKCLT